MDLKKVGIVVIGRNEGVRLKNSLRSIMPLRCPVVYVDSGSEDGSSDCARSLGISVLDLDPSRPFTPARARNEGFVSLMSVSPDLNWIQFLDGDTALDPDWPAHIVPRLNDEKTGIFCGGLREDRPEASIFHIACDTEWQLLNTNPHVCGGNMMVRVQAMKDAGGFCDNLICGEEAELIHRFYKKQWAFTKVSFVMGRHQTKVAGWIAWWKRHMRNGYGAIRILDALEKNENSKSIIHQVQSTRIWSLGWLLMMIAGMVMGGSFGGLRMSFIGGCAVFLALPLQMLRVAHAAQQKGD